MEKILIKRFNKFYGTVLPPGSKSIANRVLLLSALAEKETLIRNLPDADDIEILIFALHKLGTKMHYLSKPDGSSNGAPEKNRPVRIASLSDIQNILKHSHPLCIEGCKGQFPNTEATLYLENAGTALRPLTAALCAMHGEYIVTGNEQMKRRPIRDLTAALQDLGAHVQDTNGCPPVRIRAEGIEGGEIRLPGGVSSQFLSALLLASPLFQKDLIIKISDELVSKPYVDLTLAVLRDFGIDVHRNGYERFQIPAGQILKSPGKYTIEADASAATYFLAAGALPGCGPVTVRGLGKNSLQGDLQFVKLLQEMGARIAIGEDSIEIQGPPSGTRLRAPDRDMNEMPDAAMTLAVLALFCKGTTHIRNIANLRVKESERIHGLYTELSRLGAEVVEEPDALHITPPKQLQAASIETYKDHRMAMAFSLAAFGTDLEILDPGCVSKTYRNFFDDFLPMCRT